MNSILDQIYSLLSRPDTPKNPKHDELWAAYQPMSNRIQTAFGLDFVDQFLALRAQLDEQQDNLQFQQGFRMGAMLMLELFRSA